MTHQLLARLPTQHKTRLLITSPRLRVACTEATSLPSPPSTGRVPLQCASFGSCKLFDRRDSPPPSNHSNEAVPTEAGQQKQALATLTQHLSAAHLRSPLAMSAAESSSVSSSGQSGGGSGGAASTAQGGGENESSSNCTIIVPLRSVSEPSRTFLTAALAAAHAAEFGGRSESTRIAHYSAEPDDPAVRLRMLPPCTHTCNAWDRVHACVHFE
jgi:hypothetical protein